MTLTGPSLKETLVQLAREEEAEAASLEREAEDAPHRAPELRAFANHRRRLAERARLLARKLHL